MRLVWNLFGDLAQELFDAAWFDPSIIDLVMWFPEMSWPQFLCTAIAVMTWSWVSEFLRKMVVRWCKALFACIDRELDLMIALRELAYPLLNFSANLRRRAHASTR